MKKIPKTNFSNLKFARQRQTTEVFLPIQNDLFKHIKSLLTLNKSVITHHFYNNFRSLAK